MKKKKANPFATKKQLGASLGAPGSVGPVPPMAAMGPAGPQSPLKSFGKRKSFGR